MDFAMVVTWVLVGLLAGWLAGFVMKDGGYGLVWNLVLGLVGSSAAIVILSVLGVAPHAGTFATAVVAFIGAALVIVAQRKLWPAPRLGT
jgi:uncharacterized membrane protein YeaQ/YmgE (transglycosylase-associated protein family)